MCCMWLAENTGHKTTTTTTVLRSYVRDYPGDPVPEETLTQPPSWSSNLYQLLPSTMIHSILPVQITCLAFFCTTSLHVLFGLPLGLEPSTSYSILFFTQSLSSLHWLQYPHLYDLYRTQKLCKKKSPSVHHRTTLLGYIFITKAHIDNWKKTCSTAISPPHVLTICWMLTHLRLRSVREFGAP